MIVERFVVDLIRETMSSFIELTANLERQRMLLVLTRGVAEVQQDQVMIQILDEALLLLMEPNPNQVKVYVLLQELYSHKHDRIASWIEVDLELPRQIDRYPYVSKFVQLAGFLFGLNENMNEGSALALELATDFRESSFYQELVAIEIELLEDEPVPSRVQPQFWTAFAGYLLNVAASG